MFNYIKDAIINDVKALALKPTADAEAGHVEGLVVNQTVKNAAGEDVSTGAELVVKRVGNYKLEGIKGIVRTNGTRGQAGSYIFEATLPTDLADKDTGTANPKDVLHVELAVKMDGKYLGEYANANWAKFGKKIIVEYSAAASVEDIQKQFDMALVDTKSPFDEESKLCTVTVLSATKFKVDFTDPYLSIAVPIKKDGSIDTAADVPGVFFGYLDGEVCPVECQLQDFTECKVVCKTTDTDAAGETINTTLPVLPFATGEWLMENLRVPTYYNRRFGAVGEKNYPVAGQLYDQIAFEYVMDRPGLGGLSAVGQKIQSATTHVLYIPSQNQENVAAAESVVILENGGSKKLTAVALDNDEVIKFTVA